MSNRKIMREMSVHEASFPIIADMAPGAGNVVAALRLTVNLNIQQNINNIELDITKSFHKLQEKHPMLRAGYIETSENTGPLIFSFVELDEEIPITYRSLPNSKLDQEVDISRKSLLNHHFRRNQLLSRAIVLQAENTIVCLFCVSHAACDGSGITTCLQDWLCFLDNAFAGKSSSDIEASLPTPPPLWDSMPSKIASIAGAFRSLGVLLSLINAQKKADKGFGFPVEIPAPSEEHRCISQKLLLSPDTFSKIRKTAKRHGTGLHGIIASALVYAFIDHLYFRNDKKSILTSLDSLTLPLVTTVNVRDKTSPTLPEGTVSCLSSGISADVTVNKQQLIKNNENIDNYLNIANQVSDGVKHELNRNQHWKILRIYKIAGLKGLKKMFHDSAEKPLSTPISFANLGVIDFIKSDNLHVQDLEIQPAFHSMGAGMNITINSVNGGLTVCVTCAYPLSQEATLSDFISYIHSHLNNISEAGS